MKGQCIVLTVVAWLSVAAIGQTVDMRTFRKEITQLKADMNVLQEDMRLLLNRIQNLEQERATLVTRVKELQDLVALYERRFQKQEGLLRECEQTLGQNFAKAIDDEENARKQAVDSLRNAIAKELERIEKLAVKKNTVKHPVAQPQEQITGDYVELEVQAGDTLSSISSVAGVTVQELKQFNGLKNDNIRVGQKLKVPVAKKKQ